jgi:predicted nucleotidyltransferase
MEKQGLIKSFEFTYELSWNLMRDYSLYQGYHEIRGSRDAIRQAVLFGSRAMGSHRYGSDIDIALDADDLTFEDLLHLNTLRDDLNLPFMVDLVHIQRIDNADLIDHIHRVGKVLFCRDNV